MSDCDENDPYTNTAIIIPREYRQNIQNITMNTSINSNDWVHNITRKKAHKKCLKLNIQQRNKQITSNNCCCTLF